MLGSLFKHPAFEWILPGMSVLRKTNTWRSYLLAAFGVIPRCQIQGSVQVALLHSRGDAPPEALFGESCSVRGERPRKNLVFWQRAVAGWVRRNWDRGASTGPPSLLVGSREPLGAFV